MARLLLSAISITTLLFLRATATAQPSETMDLAKPKEAKTVDPAVPQLQVQVGHTHHVESALSPDGKWALNCGGGWVIHWDAASGKQLRRFEFVQNVSSARFSPDGKTILISGSHGFSLHEAATGRCVFEQNQFAPVARACWSPDGSRVAAPLPPRSPGLDLAAIWDAKTGKFLRTLSRTVEQRDKDGDFGPATAEFAPDGKRLLVLGHCWTKPDQLDVSAYLWSLQGDAPPMRIELPVGYGLEAYATFSKDGRRLLFSGNREFIQELDAATGKEIARHSIAAWKDAKAAITAVWTSDEKQIVAMNQQRMGVLILDAKNDRVLRTLKFEALHGEEGLWLGAGAFAADGRGFVYSTFDTMASRSFVWELDSEKPKSIFRGFSRDVQFVRFAPTGEGLVAAHRSAHPIWWNGSTGQCRTVRRPMLPYGLLANGELLARNEHDLLAGRPDQDEFQKIRLLSGVLDFAANPSGTKAVAVEPNGRLQFHDLRTDAVATLDNKGNPYCKLAISPDGRYAAVPRESDGMALVEFATRKILHEWPRFPCTTSRFAPDGKTVFLGSGHWADKEPHRLMDVATGNTLRTFAREDEVSPATSAAFSPDGSQIAVATLRHVTVFEVATGKELRKLTGHFGAVIQVDYSPDGKFVATGGGDQSVRLWDSRSGQELCKLYWFFDNSWAVVDAQGRFDASNGGNVEGLHWVVNNEPIALAQLKERYYDPGLLAKLLGRSKEPLRKVQALEKVDLFPTAKVEEPTAEGKLTLSLANRGGGIGKVQVFVNGMELLADARGPGVDPLAKEATLVVDLAHAPSLKPGQENVVEVVTWNAKGYLSSRGIQRMFTAKGAMQQDAPELHAIVVGVSEYANPTLNLRYSSKDAKDIASALELGSNKLFGADKSHITLLINEKDGKHQPPTRANIEKAFAAARSAKPGDVFVVYLAGHGVALPGDADQYCYLTSDARTADPAVLSDPAVASQYAVSGADLTEWIKKVPALKQVMVLDTCAAGAVAKKLTEQRSVSGEQIRAIERLKDRTGFHILMGCASDKVSYEATQFSQGLLTHSLLKAMRGAALRENEYVDVGSLFQYAADEVPRLAKNIGGIQKPLIAAPRGSSFDIGRLTTEEKQLVPLALPLPILLRPLLINPEEGDDNLGLMHRLRQKLADTLLQSGSERPTAVYVDSDEMPGAIRPAGTYVVEKGVVRLRINLRRDGATEASAEITGSADNLDALTEAVCSALLKKLPK